MFKVLLASALADKSGFPGFSMFHAHCEIHATLKQPCDQVYSQVNDFVQQNKDTASPPGTYKLKEEKPSDYVWSTRLTANKKYTDDQIFEVSSNANGGCNVHARSQSESLSYLDNNVNFCNMYNVLHSIDETMTYTVGDCV